MLTNPEEDIDIKIRVGDKVNMGITVIGKCDSTGNSFGDHLHVEVWLNSNTRVDPLSFIAIGGCSYEKTGSNCN